ncbi:hypothetical protein [Nocardioides sp.]
MPLGQLRVVAAVAVFSGISAAGAVVVQDKFGLSDLRQDLRIRRGR